MFVDIDLSAHMLHEMHKAEAIRANEIARQDEIANNPTLAAMGLNEENAEFDSDAIRSAVSNHQMLSCLKHPVN